MPPSITDPQPLNSENAFGEDFEGKELLPYPGDNWLSRFWEDVKTFAVGAYEGMRDESIIGKAVAGTKGIIQDIKNTTALMPALVLIIVIFFGLYLLAMGKKGKALI